MGGMSRHAETDDLIILVVLIKLRCCVATVAIYNEESIRAYCTRLRMSVEVL
jgi:hypothetical protein